MMQHWLVKSEPDVFSFDDLLASPQKTTGWDGIRSYAARLHLRAMKKGDRVFFYHSNAKPPAIVGIAEVAREAYPDPSDDEGKWDMIDIKGVEKLLREVSLDELKKEKSLQKMALIRIGRLSVSPVTPKEWEIIMKMAGKTKG
jgi:predicted RNA-binding protein with PUA-like domain